MRLIRLLARDAMRLNTTGGDNTASGDTALASNTTGSGNTAIGRLSGTYTNASAANQTFDMCM